MDQRGGSGPFKDFSDLEKPATIQTLVPWKPEMGNRHWALDPFRRSAWILSLEWKVNTCFHFLLSPFYMVWKEGLQGLLADERKECILQLKLAGIMLTPKENRLTQSGGFHKGQVKVSEAYTISSNWLMLQNSTSNGSTGLGDGTHLRNSLCFVWLVVHNRILTWNDLLKRGFQGISGPGQVWFMQCTRRH